MKKFKETYPWPQSLMKRPTEGPRLERWKCRYQLYRNLAELVKGLFSKEKATAEDEEAFFVRLREIQDAFYAAGVYSGNSNYAAFYEVLTDVLLDKRAPANIKNYIINMQKRRNLCKAREVREAKKQEAVAQ